MVEMDLGVTSPNASTFIFFKAVSQLSCFKNKELNNCALTQYSTQNMKIGERTLLWSIQGPLSCACLVFRVCTFGLNGVAVHFIGVSISRSIRAEMKEEHFFGKEGLFSNLLLRQWWGVNWTCVMFGNCGFGLVGESAAT